MKKVVVGLELQPVAGDKHLVLGMVAVFHTHVQRFKDVGVMAEAIAPYPIQLAKVPHEEGWDRVADLPRFLWQELHAKIYDLRKKAELAGKK